MKFTAAMKKYFGFREGDLLRDFAKELKELTYKDKVEYATMLRGLGGGRYRRPCPSISTCVIVKRDTQSIGISLGDYTWSEREVIIDENIQGVSRL